MFTGASGDVPVSPPCCLTCTPSGAQLGGRDGSNTWARAGGGLGVWMISQTQGLLCVVSMSIIPSNPGTTVENLLLERRAAASEMFNSFKLLC